MPSKYTLSYFNLPGAAEPIRWIFKYLNVEFEDKRFELGSEEWKLAKSKYHWEKLPVLEEVDGSEEFVLCQSLAIARYLGKKYNLVGSNERDEGKCDEYVDSAKDLYMETMPLYLERDVKVQDEIKERIIKETIPKYLPKFEEDLKSNGGNFIVGTQISWADFILAYIFGKLNETFPNTPNIFEAYPVVDAYTTNFKELPQIKEWISATASNNK